MNPQIPLDVFIPPSPEFDYVNLLATGDRHGLNDGCFLIKIKDWSVKLLSGVISFHHFKPEVKLKHSEQSALEEMIENVSFHSSMQPDPLTPTHSVIGAGLSSKFLSIGSMRTCQIKMKVIP
jgi:hypothetical protein